MTPYTHTVARYYDSRLSIFNSTDPMWYRYPHLSPYAYCADNLVNRVVLDGLAYFGVNGRVIENYGIDDQRERWTHYSWFIPPSRKDVNDSGTEIKNILSRGNGKVYIYNSNGIPAVIPFE